MLASHDHSPDVKHISRLIIYIQFVVVFHTLRAISSGSCTLYIILYDQKIPLNDPSELYSDLDHNFVFKVVCVFCPP